MNGIMREAPAAIRFCCRKCFGVLFVGSLAKGKLFCRPCQMWTPVDVRE